MDFSKFNETSNSSYTFPSQQFPVNCSGHCGDIKSVIRWASPTTKYNGFVVTGGIADCVNTETCGKFANGSNTCEYTSFIVDQARPGCVGDSAKKSLKLNYTFYAGCCNKTDYCTTTTCKPNPLKAAYLAKVFGCGEAAKAAIQAAICKVKGSIASPKNRFCDKSIVAAVRILAKCSCLPLPQNTKVPELLITKNWFQQLWNKYCNFQFFCSAAGKVKIEKEVYRRKITIAGANPLSENDCKNLLSNVLKHYDLPAAAGKIDCKKIKNSNNKYDAVIDVEASSYLSDYCVGVSSCTTTTATLKVDESGDIITTAAPGTTSDGSGGSTTTTKAPPKSNASKLFIFVAFFITFANLFN